MDGKVDTHWLIETLDQTFRLGVAMPSGFEGYLAVRNGGHVLASSGVIDEVRGGPSPRVLREYLKIVEFDGNQPLTAGVWVGWGDLDLPEHATFVELPDRPTYFFSASVAQCIKGFSATSAWYLPVSVLYPANRDWLLAGDVDDSRSYVGSSREILDRFTGSEELIVQ